MLLATFRIKKTIIKYEKRTGTTENIIELPVISQKTIKKLKKADIIRLQNVENTVQKFREKILEFVQIDLCQQMLESLGERTKIDVSTTKSHQKNYISCVYTLIQMKRATINHKNQYVQIVVDNCINHVLQNIDTKDFIYQTPEIIERNADILKYEDRQLFNHQKQLFSIQDILSNPFKLIQDSYLLLRIFLASLVLCNFLKCLDLQDIHLWSFSKLYQQL